MNAAAKAKPLEEKILFWGSMPSIFGYYLYLKYGHLTHHTNLGDPSKASLEQLFDSDSTNFEDGDVLFVAHRMRLLGKTGPTFQLPTWSPLIPSNITISISRTGFNQWIIPLGDQDGIRNNDVSVARQANGVGLDVGNIKNNLLYYWNVCMFATSFLLERMILFWNDYGVAILGRNLFFPNKPLKFHDECTEYARWSCLVRSVIWFIGGWKSILFLYLSETLWSIPPHPSSAMFVSNHPSVVEDENENKCIPTKSTYAGLWYDWFTLNTNYHKEHHDFPMIPFHKLHLLRKIAPEYYINIGDGSAAGVGENNDNIYDIIKSSFTYPNYYACMNVHNRENKTVLK